MKIFSFIKNFFETLMGFQNWKELLQRLEKPDVLDTFVQLMGGGITVSPSKRGDRHHKETPDWSDLALFVGFMEQVYSRLVREQGVSSLNDVDPFFLKLVAILHGAEVSISGQICVGSEPMLMFSPSYTKEPLNIVFHTGGYVLPLGKGNCSSIIKTVEVKHGTHGMQLVNDIMSGLYGAEGKRLLFGQEVLLFLIERPGWFFDPFFNERPGTKPTIIFPGTIGEKRNIFFFRGYRPPVGIETYQIQGPPLEPIFGSPNNPVFMAYMDIPV